jgi:hypothetical protein
VTSELIPARKPHPSKHWIAEMKYREWSLEEFSNRSGISMERLCMPFKIDREFAEGCSRAFGTSVDLWLNLQADYDRWILERRYDPNRFKS